MRSQMKELLRRVNEIEKKVGSGDVRGEVRQLMRTLEEMKCALGEGSAPKSTAATPILTMHNKTPFWNEHNQVYQLDFGGRVTQESAKNFQVEMDGKQVLQFGRIEGGAYTLDFRRPFSATQAFAVALASITQRLK
ncbi:Tub domain-containing protein [Trichostrongylus colubriformis]